MKKLQIVGEDGTNEAEVNIDTDRHNPMLILLLGEVLLEAFNHDGYKLINILSQVQLYILSQEDKEAYNRLIQTINERRK